jgi:hypothetical protein
MFGSRESSPVKTTETFVIPVKNFFFLYIFVGLECVGYSFALSLIFYFLEMSGFEPRELPLQAGAILT